MTTRRPGTGVLVALIVAGLLAAVVTAVPQTPRRGDVPEPMAAPAGTPAA